MSREAWAWMAAWAWAWAWAGAGGSLLPLDAERLRAGVAGYAVMNCHLDFPFGNEIPYHLQWDKEVSHLALSSRAAYHTIGVALGSSRSHHTHQ